MPHYIITTPAGALVALRVANSPQEATKDNPYCQASLIAQDYPPAPLNACPHCRGTKTSWSNRNIPELICYDCNRRWSLAVRKDAPDLSKLSRGLSNREKAQMLYQWGYTVYQIFPALGVSRQACYKYIAGLVNTSISDTDG